MQLLPPQSRQWRPADSQPAKQATVRRSRPRAKNKEDKRMRGHYLLLTFVLFCLICATAAVGDTYPRATALDAVHYRVQLTLTANSDEVQGETEILFQFNADGVREIPLDFAGLTTDQVLEEQRAARFTHAGEKLKVALGG